MNYEFYFKHSQKISYENEQRYLNKIISDTECGREPIVSDFTGKRQVFQAELGFKREEIKKSSSSMCLSTFSISTYRYN